MTASTQSPTDPIGPTGQLATWVHELALGDVPRGLSNALSICCSMGSVVR